MKPTPLALSLAAVLAVGASSAAMAQAYYSNSQTYPDSSQSQADYDAQQRDYQARQNAYQYQRQDYDSRVQDYQDKRDAYAVQRDRYADQRDQYWRERQAYDAQYGIGAWDRRYGSSYNGYEYRRGNDWYRDYAGTPCERSSSSGAVTGGVIGALAGAAIGSNIAGRGDRTEGAVLGGLAGAAVGASIGSNTGSRAHCDARGYYYSYNQTVPYREASYDSRYSGRYNYGYYTRQRCRLAVAPAYYNGVTDYRYVRVCPDSMGRYRITP